MKLYAPNGSEIIATADMVPGNAMAGDFTLNGNFSVEAIYLGDTAMCWDGQYTKSINGEDIFVSEDGMEWLESQLCTDEHGTALFPDRFPGKEPLGVLKLPADTPEGGMVEMLRECREIFNTLATDADDPAAEMGDRIGKLLNDIGPAPQA